MLRYYYHFLCIRKGLVNNATLGDSQDEIEKKHTWFFAAKESVKLATKELNSVGNDDVNYSTLYKLNQYCCYQLLMASIYEQLFAFCEAKSCYDKIAGQLKFDDFSVKSTHPRVLEYKLLYLRFFVNVYKELNCDLLSIEQPKNVCLFYEEIGKYFEAHKKPIRCIFEPKLQQNEANEIFKFVKDKLSLTKDIFSPRKDKDKINIHKEKSVPSLGLKPLSKTI